MHEAPIGAKLSVDTPGLGRRAACVGHSDVQDEGLRPDLSPGCRPGHRSSLAARSLVSASW